MQVHTHSGQKWALTEAPCCGVKVLVPLSCLIAEPDGLDFPHCAQEWTVDVGLPRHGLPSVEWRLNRAALRLIET